MTNRVPIDPAVSHGKPAIKRTLVGGESRKMIAEDYEITSKQISAAPHFASEMADLQISAYEAVA